MTSAGVLRSHDQDAAASDDVTLIFLIYLEKCNRLMGASELALCQYIPDAVSREAIYNCSSYYFYQAKWNAFFSQRCAILNIRLMHSDDRNAIIRLVGLVHEKHCKCLSEQNTKSGKAA